MSDQEYVRRRWTLIHQCDDSYRLFPRGTVLVQETHGAWRDFDSWAAAADFTRQREEEIRQLMEEIRWCKAGMSDWYDSIYWRWDENEREYDSVLRTRASSAREDARGYRILARLNAELALLTAGMQQQIEEWR